MRTILLHIVFALIVFLSCFLTAWYIGRTNRKKK